MRYLLLFAVATLLSFAGQPPAEAGPRLQGIKDAYKAKHEGLMEKHRHAKAMKGPKKGHHGGGAGACQNCG